MYRCFLKRALDFTAALILIILVSPVMALTWFLIRKHISKSTIFTQSRPGFDEQIFKIYKFKTMSDERGADGELLPDEARLNDYGKKIRALSLDELPQLFNVLKGDMSFIGPRPLLIEYLPLYSPQQRLRHSVRPGITGWAQITGYRGETKTLEQMEGRVKRDVWYIENWSFFLDLKIIYVTVINMFQGEKNAY